MRFASGMAAIAGLMTVLKAGDHAVVSRNVYGGTYRYFTRMLEPLRPHLLLGGHHRPRGGRGGDDGRRRSMVFLETPTNPVMDITRHRRGRRDRPPRGAWVAVDNTFLSPYLQRPLELGADFVVHSTTKFLNGHSDSICGVLVSSRQEDASGSPSCRSRRVRSSRRSTVPDHARHQDAGRAHGPPRGERAADRRLPGRITPRSGRCSTRACRTIRATRSRSGRPPASAR